MHEKRRAKHVRWNCAAEPGERIRAESEAFERFGRKVGKPTLDALDADKGAAQLATFEREIGTLGRAVRHWRLTNLGLATSHCEREEEKMSSNVQSRKEHRKHAMSRCTGEGKREQFPRDVFIQRDACQRMKCLNLASVPTNQSLVDQ